MVTGDVLGSTAGQFDFYVVSPSAPQANVSVPRDSFRRPAAEQIAVSASPGAGLTNVQLRFTTVMPGFILEEGSGSNLTYTYDATTLQKTFPNIDLYDADRYTGQDAITMSMLVSGRDAAGRLVYEARQVLLAGEELLALPAGVRAYTVPARGAISVISSGAGSAVQPGYARIQPVAGANTPTGMAIFGFRQNGILVTEAAVPASPLLRSVRIPADVNGAINTGVAIANPNEQDAVVTYYFTDAAGKDFGNAFTVVPANAQIALFLNQSPFNLAESAAATLTLNSNVPLATVALRGRTNERSEFILSALPVLDLSSTARAPTMLPHFADGGGWTTEVSLINPSDQPLTGTVRIEDPSGAPLQVDAGGMKAAAFTYTIAPRSSFRLRTLGAGSAVLAGSVRIEPGLNQIAPSAYAVFTFSNAEAVISEAAVAAASPATSFRLYAESNTRIRTGLALANAGSSDILVTAEALQLDGSSTGLSGTLGVPAKGQTALFADQIAGLQSLASGFQGVLRLSTLTPNSLVAAGLRGRTNERDEFLITTLPAQSESAAPSTAELVFPHFADGGGYTTQFILMPVSASNSGTLRFLGQAGQWLQPLP